MIEDKVMLSEGICLCSLLSKPSTYVYVYSRSAVLIPCFFLNSHEHPQVGQRKFDGSKAVFTNISYFPPTDLKPTKATIIQRDNSLFFWQSRKVNKRIGSFKRFLSFVDFSD